MEYVGRTLSKWARHDEMHSHIAGAEAKDLYPEHDNWACACPSALRAAPTDEHLPY